MGERKFIIVKEEIGNKKKIDRDDERVRIERISSRIKKLLNKKNILHKERINNVKTKKKERKV